MQHNTNRAWHETFSNVRCIPSEHPSRVAMQLRALAWKNFLLMKRHWGWSVAQVATILVFLVGFRLLQMVNSSTPPEIVGPEFRDEVKLDTKWDERGKRNPGCRLGYFPNTSFVTDLMDRAGKQFFRGVESEMKQGVTGWSCLHFSACCATRLDSGFLRVFIWPLNRKVPEAILTSWSCLSNQYSLLFDGGNTYMS